MRLTIVAALIFALAGLAAISINPAAAGAFNHDQARVLSASTCDTRHCSPNTHCCYSCDGSPIRVKNGVPCPECAPQ